MSRIVQISQCRAPSALARIAGQRDQSQKAASFHRSLAEVSGKQIQADRQISRLGVAPLGGKLLGEIAIVLGLAGVKRR